MHQAIVYSRVGTPRLWRIARRTLRALWITIVSGGAAVACSSRPPAAPPSPAPRTTPSAAPQPAPGPSPVDSLAAQDSGRAADSGRLPGASRARRAATRGRRAVPRKRTRPVPPFVSDAGPVIGGVRVCAGGDVTLGTNLDTAWAATVAQQLARPVPALPLPGRALAPLAPLLGGADVVLLNVEGAIGDEWPVPSKCAAGERGCFALRQPPATAAALRALASSAQVVGNLANNHTRDAGLRALQRTIEHLREAGVHVTGVDTLATPVRTAAGETIAFLGFSTSARPNARDVSAVRRHVARAAAHYRRVVVTAHMGAEGPGAQRTRDTVERYFGEHRGNPVLFADAAVAGGAALVVMHGPHVLRAIEWRGGQLVAYSLGNLVTYGPFSFREPLARGAVLCAAVDANGHARSPTLHATRQRRPGVVAADPSGRAYALVDSLGRLDFPGTAARVTRAGAVLKPRPPAPARRRARGADRR